MEKKSVFETLNNINVSNYVEEKNGLKYLAWANAWAEVKKLYPLAQYKIYEREIEWGAVNYFTDGRTCWVKTGVEIDGLEHIEELPVMDYRNKSIPYDKVTSFDVNKAIQRSLTKALARHGLGLYIYAGEDLPEVDKQKEEEKELGKVIAKICTLQTTMNKLGIDWRGEMDSTVLDWILQKAQVESQDIAKLDLDSAKRLEVAYNALIKGIEKKREQK